MTEDQDPEYIAARRVLLDALIALEPEGTVVIVAGAQTVYLRTGSVAPFTVDGDLAIDPNKLRPDPVLEEVMEAADFSLQEIGGGHIEPGIWMKVAVVDGRTFAIALI